MKPGCNWKKRGLVLFGSFCVPYLAILVVDLAHLFNVVFPEVAVLTDGAVPDYLRIIASRNEICMPVALLCFLAMAVSEYTSPLSWFRRALLLFVSFFIPFSIICFITTDVYHSENGSWFGYLAGCFGLGAMGISLAAGKIWWLAASFLFPMLTIYGFWTTYFLANLRWRS